MREDRFTHTEADAGLYERQRAQDDCDPPDVDREAKWCADCNDALEPNDEGRCWACTPGALDAPLPIEVRDPRCFTEIPF